MANEHAPCEQRRAQMSGQVFGAGTSNGHMYGQMYLVIDCCVD